MRNQKGLTPIVIILLIAVAIGGYLIYSGKIGFFQKQTEQTQIHEVDETADWKIYTTDKFSFKYPGNYIVKESYKDFYELYLDETPINTHTVIGIDATLNYAYTDYNKAVDSQKKLLKDPLIEEIPNGIKITGNQDGGFGAGVLHKLALLKYKQGAIQIEAADPDENTNKLFDQILSTFKFTD